MTKEQAQMIRLNLDFDEFSKYYCYHHRDQEDKEVCWRTLNPCSASSCPLILREEAIDADVRAENKFRTDLWLSHGCDMATLYGDDGEMQCGKCVIDFKRDQIKDIFEKLKRGPSDKAACCELARLKVELENIASKAKSSTEDDLCDLKDWAQNRARFALTKRETGEGKKDERIGPCRCE